MKPDDHYILNFNIEKEFWLVMNSKCLLRALLNDSSFTNYKHD